MFTRGFEKSNLTKQVNSFEVITMLSQLQEQNVEYLVVTSKRSITVLRCVNPYPPGLMTPRYYFEYQSQTAVNADDLVGGCFSDASYSGRYAVMVTSTHVHYQAN